MKKSTARPTAAQIQRNQAQADRKAAALARRADRAAGAQRGQQHPDQRHADDHGPTGDDRVSQHATEVASAPRERAV